MYFNLYTFCHLLFDFYDSQNYFSICQNKIYVLLELSWFNIEHEPFISLDFSEAVSTDKFLKVRKFNKAKVEVLKETLSIFSMSFNFAWCQSNFLESNISSLHCSQIWFSSSTITLHLKRSGENCYVRMMF